MGRAATGALLLTGALAVGEGPAAGQAAGAGPPPPASGADGVTTRSPGVGSSDSERPRDPFVDPFLRNRQVAPRPRGRAGIAVDELTLRGLVLFAGAHVALLEADNGMHYLFRGGERLFDGSVRSVTAEGVVLVRRAPEGSPNAGGRVVRLTLSAATGGER